METAKNRDADTIAYLRKEIEELRHAQLQAQRQQQQQQHHQQQQQHQQAPTSVEASAPRHFPPPPEPESEQPVNYATATGSMKRRRGRTLRGSTRTQSSTERSGGRPESSPPELAAVRV